MSVAFYEPQRILIKSRTIFNECKTRLCLYIRSNWETEVSHIISNSQTTCFNGIIIQCMISKLTKWKYQRTDTINHNMKNECRKCYYFNV